eukprot:gene25215-32904_t
MFRRRCASSILLSIKHDWQHIPKFSAFSLLSPNSQKLSSPHFRGAVRNLSTSPSKSTSSLPYGSFNEDNSDVENENTVPPEDVAAAVEEDFYDLAKKQTFFLNDYYRHPVPMNNNVFERCEGDYVELDPNDIKKYLPEGLAGDAADEFDFSSQKCWMIRNSSKVLFRLLDSFAQEVDVNSINKNVVPRVSVAGLTDRPEWTLAKVSVMNYGKELLKETAETSLEVTQGEGSVVDDVIPGISSAIKNGAKNIMITGPRGSGKSMVLSQTVFHARLNGWLCLFIPRGWEQVQTGPHVHASKANPNVYDNFNLSSEVLRGFWRAHKDLLRTIPMANVGNLLKYRNDFAKFEEVWKRIASVPGREKIDYIGMRALIEEDDSDPDEDAKDVDVLKGFDYRTILRESLTLEDLVRCGVAHRYIAGSIFEDLMVELKQLTSVPVLIAVDQYNTWEVDSAFSITVSERKSIRIPGFDLCVPRALRFLQRKKFKNSRLQLQNGIFLCSTSFKHVEGNKLTYENYLDSIPLAIRVPNFNQREFLSSVAYYGSRLIVPEKSSLNDILAFRIHTASNPLTVRQQAVPYFLPRVEAEMDERINYSTIQNLKELTDGKYEDLDKGDIDEGSFTKGIFADGGAITDEDE